jgi:hypothetical protein
MPAAATPATTTLASLRARLLHAQSAALDTLLHLAEDLTNPAQARLAATALLRTRLPDADESEGAAQPDEVAAKTPNVAPPRSSDEPAHARTAQRQPRAPEDTRSALSAALDRITRAPSSAIAAKLLASGADIGHTSATRLLTG